MVTELCKLGTTRPAVRGACVSHCRSQTAKLNASLRRVSVPEPGRAREPDPRAQVPTTVSGTSSVASKYEELECLYAAVGKVIYEGLTNYEKATSANPSQLFGERVSIVVFPAWSSCALDELFLLGPRGADPLQAKIFL